MPRAFAEWVPLTHATAEGLCGARELANNTHGVVVIFGLPADGSRIAQPMFDAIADLGSHLAADFKPQELANTIWGLAKASHRAPRFGPARGEGEERSGARPGSGAMRLRPWYPARTSCKAAAHRVAMLAQRVQ